MGRPAIHGHSKVGGRQTPTYSTWMSMRRRCFDPKEKAYSLYGGRGITICERWMQFENFLEDMGERPTGMTLDRIDSNGNYEPGNCRWANEKLQKRNMRTNRLISVFGETACVSEWAEKYGIRYFTLVKRLNEGWPPEKALTTPVRKWTRKAA